MDIPLKFTIQKTGLPLIVTSSKPHLCFLVDSGSTHNLIFSYVMEALDEVISIDASTSIKGITGNTKGSKQIEYDVAFDEIWYTAQWTIVEAPMAVMQIQNETGVQVHGILGINFLLQNKWILDFKNLTINI